MKAISWGRFRNDVDSITEPVDVVRRGPDGEQKRLGTWIPNDRPIEIEEDDEQPLVSSNTFPTVMVRQDNVNEVLSKIAAAPTWRSETMTTTTQRLSRPAPKPAAKQKKTRGRSAPDI